MPHANARKPTSKSSPNSLQVGRIVGTFGIKGEAKVEPLTDFPEDRFFPGARLVASGRWLTIESVRLHQGRMIVKFEELDTPEEVKKIHLSTLEAHSVERPTLVKDEFLFEDLIGLDVQESDGRLLGKVEEVLAYPAHEILQVGELLIPFVGQFIEKVDLNGSRIVVRLIPGMGPGGQ